MPAIVRFASQLDTSSLAELRWLSRSMQEQDREALSAFAPRFGLWLSDALASGAWNVAVAQVAGGPVGCMYLRKVETVPVPGVDARAWGYVTAAFVKESHRNGGIGREMLAHLILRAREIHLTELHVWPSTRAVSLYVRAGFLSPEQQRASGDPDEPSYVLPLM